MVARISNSIAICLCLRCADAWNSTTWNLKVSTGQCDPSGLEDDKVAEYEGAFDSCSKIAIPGLDVAVGVMIRCTDAGPRVNLFEDKTCKEESKVRQTYIGISGGCMMLTGVGHFASLTWKASACKEGPKVQTSDTCQSKSNELAASEPEYNPDIHACQEYYCPEIRNFDGVIDYGALKSDCTCTVEYKDKQNAMEQCKALPGGAKTCFVTYKVENDKGARLHIGNGMADCVPESCSGAEDMAALAQQWTLSCLDLPGVSTCAATVSCVDPPTTTTSAPAEGMMAVASGALDTSFESPVLTFCAAILFMFSSAV